MQRFFELDVFVVESLTFTSVSLFVSSRVFYLAILDLNKLTQILVFFL